MKKLLLSLLFVTGIATLGHGQIFSQTFNDFPNISDYVNATGETNKFTALSTTSSSNLSVSIEGGALKFAKISNGGTGYFSRNVNFPGPPSVLKISFKISVTDIAGAGTTQAQLYVGDSFANTSGAPGLSDVHSRLVFNFHATEGFYISGPNSPTGSTPNYNTTKIVTWVINNSGNNIEYLAPNGSAKTLANDAWDLYVDEVGSPSGTPVLAGRGVETATKTLSNIFFRYPTGSQNATIIFDDILINDQTTVLPVMLTSFTAQQEKQTVKLTWQTLSETNNSHFDIERSTDGKNFVKIASVQGKGNSNQPTNYAFADEKPAIGHNYYRLAQIDHNGVTTLYTLVSVKYIPPFNNFIISTNADKTIINIAVDSPVEGSATLQILDLNGTKLGGQSFYASKGTNIFAVEIPSGKKGVHIAFLQIGNRKIKKKILL